MVGDGICYPVTGQYSRKCHISSGQCFADAHYIRFYSGVFPRKKFAGTSESCCYFVEDKKNIVLSAKLFSFTQVLRMIKPHSACSLYHWFQDKRRQLF